MNNSAPIIHRSLKREREKILPGTVMSFTTIKHPPARFGNRPRTIGLIELEDGRRVLAPLISEAPFIGQQVRPRMRLSHVTNEGLRVYEVAYEARATSEVNSQKFLGYILALTGPSGVGKSTLSRMLVKACSDFAVNVPIITTRAPKHGDDGEYIYATQEEFERMQRAGAIVTEAKISSASENRRYGYRGADIEKIWSKGKLPVVIAEMNLLKGLAKRYGRRSVLSFGLLPPGNSKRAKLSHLLHRLRGRGRETEREIKSRLENAKRDLAFFAERKDLFDHIVVNDDAASAIVSMKEKVLRLSEL